MSINKEKNILRKELIFRRKSVLYKEEKELKIQNRVLKLDIWNNSSQVLLYMSTNDEISTEKLLLSAWENGKEVCIPYCPQNGEDMQFYCIKSKADLTLGNFNIMEPNITKCSLANINQNALCVVPALAYSKKGYRIGYGKGYYDRFFEHNKVLKVGLCYDDFLFENLPLDEFDKAVDIIVTDKQTLKGKKYE